MKSVLGYTERNMILDEERSIGVEKTNRASLENEKNSISAESIARPIEKM